MYVKGATPFEIMSQHDLARSYFILKKKGIKEQEMGAVAGHVVSGQRRIIPDLLRQIAHTAPE